MTTTNSLLAAAAAALAAAEAYIVGRRHGRRRVQRETPRTIMRSLQARISDLRSELELERMRVVACGVAACGVRLAIDDRSAYWSPSYEDARRLADRAAAQATLLAAIADGSCLDPVGTATAFLRDGGEPAGVRVEEIWPIEGLHLPPNA